MFITKKCVFYFQFHPKPKNKHAGEPQGGTEHIIMTTSIVRGFFCKEDMGFGLKTKPLKMDKNTSR